MASGNSSWKLYFLQMLHLGVGQIGFKAKSNKHYHNPTGRRVEDLQRSGGLPRDPWVFVISLYSNLQIPRTAIAVEVDGQQSVLRRERGTLLSSGG